MRWDLANSAGIGFKLILLISTSQVAGIIGVSQNCGSDSKEDEEWTLD
jgi:hypothetical protein